jgi:hypothetical protein
MLSLFSPAYNSDIHRKNGKIKQKTKIAHKSYLYQTILSNCKEYRKKSAEKNAAQTAPALPASTEKIFFANFSSHKKNRRQYI